MPTKLARDATIISVYDTLTHAERQTKAAYNRALQCSKEHANVSVRIGVTGSGQKPCYRVVYQGLDGVEQIFGSWWDMGEELSREDAVNGNWSTAAVSLDDLETFLRKRLTYTGPRPR